MRAHALACLIVAALAASSAAAQPASMAGRVRGPGGVPFRGAQVLVDDSVAAVSDDSGRFVVAPVVKGVHRVMVRAIGFGPVQNAFRVGAGERLEREFTLQVNADTLAAVTIVGDRGERLPMRLKDFEDRRISGAGHYLDRAELDRRGNDQMSTVLRRMPAMTIKRSGGSSAYAVNTRGHCNVNIYLDGNLVSSTLPFDVNMLPPSSLHGVEYYAGGATIPVMYHRTGFEKCGVMIIWTR